MNSPSLTAHHSRVRTSLIDAEGVGSRQGRLSQAIDEFYAAIDAGESIDRDILITKYADIADELADCLHNLDFIEQALPQLSKASNDIAKDNSPSFSNRAHLGDFRILRELGRGGMGVVYEAEQLSIGRKVALKVLPFAAMLDKQQLSRFKNEARAAGTLDHPNIVAVFSVGTERGVHYYAMQLIEGQSLAQVIEDLRGRVRDQTPPPHPTGEGALADTAPVAKLSTLPDVNSREYFRANAKLGIQAAEALDHAHQNGILHRDVKPGNLLVDDAGKLYVTDFGLARIETEAGMTMTGDLLGTLRYMSPEQALGKRAVIDHRSDIYALGVTFYELLTLRPAFAGDDHQELLRKIASEEPTNPRQINPRIPQDLETIILKAIEKEAADRYETSGELAADLRRFSQDEPIRAKRSTMLVRAAKWSRRHNKVLATVTAFVILLVVGTTVATWQAFQATRERDRAIQAGKVATFEAARADAEAAKARTQAAISREVSEFLLSDLLSMANPKRTEGISNVAPDPELKLRTLVDLAAERIDGRFEDKPVVEAAIHKTIGETYSGLGLYQKALHHRERAVELLTDALGPEDADTIRQKHNLASAYGEVGWHRRAEQCYRDLLEIERREFGARNKTTLTTKAGLAQSLMQQSRFDEAEKILSETFDIAHDAYGAEAPTTLLVNDLLGQTYFFQDRLPKAEQVFRELLAIRRRTLPLDHLTTLNSMQALGTVLESEGDYKESERLHREALNGLKAKVGDAHPATLRAMNSLASSLMFGKHDYLEAENILRDALTIAQKLRGPEHPTAIQSLSNLGLALAGQERNSEAQECWTIALELRQKVSGPGHPDTIVLADNLLGLIESETDGLRELNPDRKASLVHSCWVLAQVFEQQHRLSEARVALSKGMEVYSTLESDPRVSDSVADDAQHMVKKLQRVESQLNLNWTAPL